MPLNLSLLLSYLIFCLDIIVFVTPPEVMDHFLSPKSSTPAAFELPYVCTESYQEVVLSSICLERGNLGRHQDGRNRRQSSSRS